MIPAWDYSQVLRDLKRAFEWRYEKNGCGGVRMVGLLFAPPLMLSAIRTWFLPMTGEAQRR